MSKMGGYVFQMQEDAQWMAREQWIKVYGLGNISVYEELNGKELREVIDHLDSDIEFLREAQKSSETDEEIARLKSKRDVLGVVYGKSITQSAYFNQIIRVAPKLLIYNNISFCVKKDTCYNLLQFSFPLQINNLADPLS